MDQDALLTEHRQFVFRLGAEREGRVVKPEGDGLWLVFPSGLPRRSLRDMRGRASRGARRSGDANGTRFLGEVWVNERG